jgi:hypothetical protein
LQSRSLYRLRRLCRNIGVCGAETTLKDGGILMWDLYGSADDVQEHMGKNEILGPGEQATCGDAMIGLDCSPTE